MQTPRTRVNTMAATVQAGDVRHLTTASGQAFDMRAIVAKYAGQCYVCRGKFAAGELVWWIKNTGSHHVEDCRVPAAPTTCTPAPAAKAETVATSEGPKTLREIQQRPAPHFAPSRSGREMLYGSARTRICRGCGRPGDDGECGLGNY